MEYIKKDLYKKISLVSRGELQFHKIYHTNHGVSLYFSDIHFSICDHDISHYTDII